MNRVCLRNDSKSRASQSKANRSGLRAQLDATASWCDARIPLTRPEGHPLPIRWGAGTGWGVFGNLADRTGW